MASLPSWAAYLIKAAVVVAVLALLARFAPVLPAWALGIGWAALSLVPALGGAYHVVIRKTYKQKQYEEGGFHGRINRGRAFSLVACFVVSAVLVAGIILDSPRWDLPLWVLVVLAVPAYWGIQLLVGSFLRTEYAPLYRQSRTALYGAGILGVLLCLVYAIIASTAPVPTYAQAADAILAVPRPFAASPSALLSEAGDFAATFEALRAYGLTKLADESFGVYGIWHALLKGSALFGVASLLSVCSIATAELRRVFAPISRDSSTPSEKPLVRHYVALAVALPVALCVGLCVAEANFSDIRQSRQYTFAQEFARNVVNFTVYSLDGKYYDPQGVDRRLESLAQDSTALSRQAEEVLVPLINASFDARVANVDSYLDWYYRLFGDWEQLFQMVKGTGEEFAQEQLQAHIEAGIDDTRLNAEYETFLKRADELQERIDNTEQELAQYEISGTYPEWLLIELTPGQLEDKIAKAKEPSQQFLNAGTRLGVSAAAGIAAGFLAKKLVTKIAQKSVFKVITGRVATLVSASVAATTTGPGAPVIIGGTVIADIALTKADELLNRESYKQELVAAIEEERASMLAAVGAPTS